jgi:hypothetical protein
MRLDELHGPRDHAALHAAWARRLDRLAAALKAVARHVIHHLPRHPLQPLARLGIGRASMPRPRTGAPELPDACAPEGAWRLPRQTGRKARGSREAGRAPQALAQPEGDQPWR